MQVIIYLAGILSLGWSSTPWLSSASAAQLTLVWDDNSNDEFAFKIERKLGLAGFYAEVAIAPGNTTIYTDPDLLPNTTYFYRVRAFNGLWDSEYSNEVSGTSPNDPDGVVPSSPTALIATAIDSQRLSLDWVDTSSTEVGFKIERRLSTSSTFIDIANVGADVTTYTDTGLAAGTTYFYRVSAKGTAGNSGYSNVASGTTLPPPPPVPSPPSGLAATTIDTQSIRLTWVDESSNETGFRIEANLLGGVGVYFQIATIEAGITSYTHSNLLPNTTYFYRVRAFSVTGNSDYSNEAGGTTASSSEADVPSSPTSLAATTIDSQRLNLNWVDTSSIEVGFKIERRLSSDSTFIEIASAGANVTTYTDTGLGSNTTYVYRVRASGTAGNSGYSNEATATTLPPVPDAPSGLTATPVDSQRIRLNWVDASSNETAFRIERRASAIDDFVPVAIVGANVATYTDIGLVPSTTYFYRVTAEGTSGDSEYSIEVSATTPAPRPATPSGLAASTVDSGRVRLNWVDQSSNETGFTIARKVGLDSFNEVAIVGANVTTYLDTGLAPDTTYVYRVRATGSPADSGYSNEASATTLPTRPSAPSNLATTTIDSQRVKLKWLDRSSNETGFRIDRKVSTAGAFVQVAIVGVNVTTYKDTGLVPSTTYFYRVRALGTSGNSTYSNAAGVTTDPPPPSPPSGLSATAIDSQRLRLTWVDESDNESGFKIERKLSTTGSYAQIATVAADVTSYMNSNLLPNTAYSYRVRAVNAGGNSPYSNEASATTGAAAMLSSDEDLAFFNAPSASATFVAVDRATQGRWNGTYGADGFYTIEDSINLPAYAQISASGAAGTIWAATSSDQRALQRAALQDRFAAGWASETGFAVDLDLGDAQTHRIAFYCLDWDDGGCVQTVNVMDASTGALIDSQTLSGFDRGAYLIWDLQGHLQIQFNREAGPGAVLSGIFFDPVAETVVADPPQAPHSLGATLADGQSPTLVWVDTSDNEAGFSIERGPNVAGPFNQIATVSEGVTSYTDTDVLPDATYVYRVFAFGQSGTSDYSNELVFTGGVFSGDGLDDSDVAGSAPPEASVPNDPQTLSVALVDGQHLALTWSDTSDNETGFAIERNTGPGGSFDQIALVGANVTAYSDSDVPLGADCFYRVRATGPSGDSGYSNETSVTTGVAPTESPAAATARFIALDGATQGTWNGTYGTDGYYVIGDAVNSPAYVQIYATDRADWIWASSSDDPRALQRASLSDRLAAGGSSFSSFVMYLDLLDNQPHRVAFYCLDWDTGDRVQTIDVLDASTGAVLDSQSLANFNQGAYLVWSLQGSVRIRFTRVAGQDAVLSGIFFDPIGESSASD